MTTSTRYKAPIGALIKGEGALFRLYNLTTLENTYPQLAELSKTFGQIASDTLTNPSVYEGVRKTLKHFNVMATDPAVAAESLQALSNEIGNLNPLTDIPDRERLHELANLTQLLMNTLAHPQD